MRGISAGSTVPGAVTRMRSVCPLVLLRTRIVVPFAPASSASPAVLTSIPSMRAIITTASPRFTKTGAVSELLRRTSPARNERRLVCPTASCVATTGSAMVVMSRCAIARWRSVSSSLAAIAAATTTTDAEMRARTMYSRRLLPACGQRTAKRIRLACRVSSVSTSTGPGQFGATRGGTTVSSKRASARPEAAACFSSWARAASSTWLVMDGAAKAGNVESRTRTQAARTIIATHPGMKELPILTKHTAVHDGDRR